MVTLLVIINSETIFGAGSLINDVAIFTPHSSLLFSRLL